MCLPQGTSQRHPFLLVCCLAPRFLSGLLALMPANRMKIPRICCYLVSPLRCVSSKTLTAITAVLGGASRQSVRLPRHAHLSLSHAQRSLPTVRAGRLPGVPQTPHHETPLRSLGPSGRAASAGPGRADVSPDGRRVCRPAGIHKQDSAGGGEVWRLLHCPAGGLAAAVCFGKGNRRQQR